MPGCSKACDNLRVFMISQPPLVLFMLTLMCFAGALVGFSVFILDNDINDPTVKQDWNTYLAHFSDVEFCLSTEDGLTISPDVNNMTSTSSTQLTGEGGGAVSMDTDSMTVSSIVSLAPGKHFHGFPENITHILVDMNAAHFGVTGDLSSNYVRASFVLFEPWDSTHCQPSCVETEILACLTLTGVSAIFPRQKHTSCEAMNYTTSASAAAGSVSELGLNMGLHNDIIVSMHQKPMMFGLLGTNWCDKGALLSVYHRINPLLTALLSTDDRSMMNLHLLHTSYFLFVMVIFCICYAMIRGRVNSKRKGFTLHSSNAEKLSEFDA